MSKHILLAFAFAVAYSGNTHTADMHQVETSSNRIVPYQENRGNDDETAWRRLVNDTTIAMLDHHKLVPALVTQYNQSNNLTEENAFPLTQLKFKENHRGTLIGLNALLQALKSDSRIRIFACENKDFLKRYFHAQQLGSPSSYVIIIPGNIVEVPAFARITASGATGAPVQTAITLVQPSSSLQSAALPTKSNSIPAVLKTPGNNNNRTDNNSTENAPLLPNKASTSKNCCCTLL